MTASALIQLLQGVAPDTLVVVDTGAGGPMIERSLAWLKTTMKDLGIAEG